jgi:DNA uptake protein ComE-like DNA-binding protein
VETEGPVAEAPARRRGRRPRAEVEAVPEAAPPLQQPAGGEPAPRTRRRRQQPTEGESVPASAGVGAENGQADEDVRLTAGELVNLNTATRGQLMRLPRIGAGAADRIIQFRETQGPIRNIRQLRQAEIIQPSAARQIRDLVRF